MVEHLALTSLPCGAPEGAPGRTRLVLVALRQSDVGRTRAALDATGDRYDVVHVDSVARAMAQLDEAGGVLLDLDLPEPERTSIIARVHRRAPDVPIVVLTDDVRADACPAALRAGAQDCLVKRDVTPATLGRALRHALERQRTQNQVMALAEAGRHLTETLDTGEVSQRIVDIVHRVLDVRHAGLFALDAETGELVCVAAGGAAPAREAWLGRRLLPGEGVSARAVATRRVVSSRDVFADPSLTIPPWLAERIRHDDMETIVCAPLLGGAVVLGVLAVGHARGRSLSPQDETLLAAFAGQAAVALQNARLHEETRRRLAHTETLLAVTQTVETMLDVTESARRIARETARAIGADTVALLKAQPGGTLHAIAGYRVPADRLGALQALQVSMDREALVSEARDTGRVVWVADVGADERISAEIRAMLPCRSLIFAPLMRHGQCLGGLVGLWWRTRPALDVTELRLFEGIARHAALVVDAAHACAAAERGRREAELLAELARGICGSLDLDQVLARITAGAAELVGADLARIFLRRDGSEAMEARYWVGEPVAAWHGHVIVPGRGLGGAALVTGRPQRTADYAADPRHDPEYLALSVQERLVSMLVVPIRGSERIDGLLYVVNHTRRAFTDRDQTVLERLADHAAVALHNARLFAQERAAAEALRKSEEQLRHAQKMEAIGRLAGGVAHDFNNLLTVVLGRTQLLRERLRSGDARTRRDLEIVQRTTEKAADLTRQLLAFSRKQVLQPKRLDLNAVVAGMERILQRLLGEHIELVVSGDPDLGVVLADPGQVEQILLNLAVNARDAMPDGGTITMATANVTVEEGTGPVGLGAGRYVMLTFSDTGHGMDEETQAQIFEPFFTTKPVGAGTGLGLATVYGILQQSGGAITVESAVGQGATFRIYLPRIEAEAEAIETPVPAHGRGTETILVVEDDPEVRVLAREVLVASGYTVLEASRPGEALAMADAAQVPIPLLVTDVVMPDMSGPALAEALRRRHPGMRILYMSGYPADAIGGRQVPESDMPFLAKPFSPRALARKVRDVLDAPPGEMHGVRADTVS